MDQISVGERSKARKGILGCFIAIGSLLLLYIVLGMFDNTTELSPDHDGVLLACFAIAGLSGVALGIIGIRESKGIPVWRRAPLALALSLLGFLAVFLASSRTATTVEGLIDFPSGKTRSYTTLLLISRAYQAHGKGRSWNIQTTPIWSNLNITEDDYQFMLAHRRVGDDTRDPDEISSHGFFCAHVTIQQSGNAIRILHAGGQKLPKGSVVICPSKSDP
jgi:hypothetical protein